MANNFIENNFWNKTLLANGHHDVEITCIESGTNLTIGTPFIICIFENNDGYFPKKINLKLESERNKKYVNNLFKSVGLKEPSGNINYQDLLNKKLRIFISLCLTLQFGKGVQLNSFSQIPTEQDKTKT